MVGGTRSFSRRVVIGAVGQAALSMGMPWLLRARAQPAPLPMAGNLPINCAPVNPPATAVKFTPDTALAMRVRKSAFDLDRTEVERLAAAYAALRRLSRDDPLDPRGWLNQAHVHCWYCGGPKGDEAGAGPEIHGSWNFLPWHRAYLYFHERTLARLIGDDSFALPYWDWDTLQTVSNGRTVLPRAVLPLAYINPNSAANPLFDPYRLAGPTDRISDSLVGKAVIDRILMNSNPELFFGSSTDAANPVASNLEFGPHGAVHIWVGDPLSRDPVGSPDMGVLATAAQDPIFFAHHGNIDRFWERWLAQDKSRTNPPDPTDPKKVDPKWLDISWKFFDENGTWTEIAVSDVIDHENSLRYQYAPPNVPATAASVAAASAVVVAAQAAAPPAPTPPLAVVPPGTGVNVGPAPVTRSVALPSAHREAFSVSPSSSGGAQYLLRLSGIKGPPGASAIVRVFVNLPSASAETSLADPHYLGYFTLVPGGLGGMHSHGKGLNAAFAVEGATLAALKNEDSLAVTLVPVATDGAPPPNVSLTVDSIELTSH